MSPPVMGLVLLFAVLGLSLQARGAGEEGDFSLSGITRLTVEGSFFEIDLAGRAGSRVDAEIRVPPRLRRRGLRVLHERRGSELRVWVERSLWAGFGSTAGAQMIFRVPTATQVEVRNSSGSVTVAGLESVLAAVETSSGRVRLERVSGDMAVSTSSGSVEIENCQGTKTISSTSGRITVSGSDGDISATSSSGGHTYRNTKGALVAESSSGKIGVYGAQGAVELRSTSGDLRGEDIVVTDDSSFRTSSGSIDIDLADDTEEFTFELTSTSGTVAVGGTKAKKGNVRTGTGRIRITGRTTSGSQAYH